MFLILALFACSSAADEGCYDGDLLGYCNGSNDCFYGADFDDHPGPSSDDAYDVGFDDCFPDSYRQGWSDAGCFD